MASLFCKKHIAFLTIFASLTVCGVANSQTHPPSDTGVISDPVEVFDIEASDLSEVEFNDQKLDISDDFDDLEIDIESFSDDLLDIESDLQERPTVAEDTQISNEEKETKTPNVSDSEKDYIPPTIKNSNSDKKSTSDDEAATNKDSGQPKQTSTNDNKDQEIVEKYRKMKVHLTNFLRVFNNKNAEILPIEQTPVDAISDLAENDDNITADAEEIVENKSDDEPTEPPANEETAEIASNTKNDEYIFESPSMEDDDIESLLNIDEEELIEQAPIDKNITAEVATKDLAPEKTETPVLAKETAQEDVKPPVAKKEDVKSERQEVVKKPTIEIKHPTKVVEENRAEEVEKPLMVNDKDRSFIEEMDKKSDHLPKSKQLSKSSSDVINKIAKPIAKEKQRLITHTPTKKISIKREDDETTSEFGIDEQSSSEFSMSVRDEQTNKKKEFNVAQTMTSAYRALMMGQTSASIQLYKDVLEASPNHKNAKLGLATAYHKNYQVDQAREIYTSILKDEPNNKEALNNFLVLVAEEAPEDALFELKKLERLNSQFSPVTAQIAMIYLKLKKYKKAERYLRRAVILSPENITYKYNLAIISDRLRKYPQAIRVYRQIIEQAEQGVPIPGSIEQLSERLHFLEKKAKLN